jgi:hypothetical protein
MAAPQVLTNWYTAKTADTPSTGGGLLANPATYKPATLDDPAKWQIDNKQTVAGQLESVVRKDSPLQQLARTEGLQQAQKRGLLNSSMAVGAAQDAITRSALPIAQADADVNARAAGYNADTSNKFKVANVDTLNTAGSFGAQAINRANEFNAGNAVQQAESNREREFSNWQADKERANSNRQADIQRGYDDWQSNKQRDFDKQQALFESNVKASLAQIENEARFDQNLQNVYGNFSQEFTRAMTAINQDNNMNQQSKDYAINQLFDAYKAQISLLSAVGSVPDVSELLIASGPATPGSGAAVDSRPKTKENFSGSAYLQAHPDVARDAYWSQRPWEHYQLAQSRGGTHEFTYN